MSIRRTLSASALGAALFAFVLAAPSAHQPAAAGPEFLQAFIGDWRGQGAFRPSPRHESQSVVCRARGALNGAGQLEISGRCGGEGFTGTFRVTAQYDPQSGGYTALFAGPPSVGSSHLFGERDGESLRLSINHPGQPPSTLMVSHLSPSAFHIRAVTTAGEQAFTSAEIQLRRQ